MTHTTVIVARGAGGLLTEVTLAAQKPFVLPLIERARLKKLPHTMALKVVPSTHLIKCGTENLQRANSLLQEWSKR